MYEYYDNYKKAAGDADAQARWVGRYINRNSVDSTRYKLTLPYCIQARQLTWEIARHAVGEEIVVYPLMEQHMGHEGIKLADQDRADHQVQKFPNEPSLFFLRMYSK